MSPPIKFKPTERNYDRRSGKFNVVYHHMKAKPKNELFNYINSTNAKPKIVQKCINELTRRGIKIKWN
tara:strand:+ start:150 stop:353 length:204 start_codon:yes stop_codon:yes gene_type:complete